MDWYLGSNLFIESEPWPHHL